MHSLLTLSTQLVQTFQPESIDLRYRNIPYTCSSSWIILLGIIFWQIFKFHLDPEKLFDMILTVINSIIAVNKIAKNLIKSENNCTFRNKKLQSICIPYQQSLLLNLHDTFCYIRGWTVVRIFTQTFLTISRINLDLLWCSYFALQVIYNLLSIKYNSRIRVLTYTDELTGLDSTCKLFPGSNWYEREVSNIIGILITIDHILDIFHNQ